MVESDTNEELRDLQTHSAGATDLHETREIDKPEVIDPAEVSVGPYDTRTGKFELKKEQ